MRRRVPGLLAAALVSLLTVGAIGLSSTSAQASGTLSSVAMAVSNNATSATGVTYTWNFTTATAATLTSLTMTVPAGTTGTSLTAGATAYGLLNCTITSPTLSSGTVTVTLSGCASIPASTPVSISVSGFTNTATKTVAFASAVATSTGTVVDAGTAVTGVDFDSNLTQVTVVVPESLTFLNGNETITLLPIPGSPTPATASPVTLTVKTNAASGYTLRGCVLSPIGIGATANTIPQLSTPGALTGSAFGAQASVTGVGASLAGSWASANGASYLGYDSLCTGGTRSVISQNSGPTNGDVLTLTNAATISATQAAGTYTGVITYQVVPSF